MRLCGVRLLGMSDNLDPLDLLSEQKDKISQVIQASVGIHTLTHPTCFALLPARSRRRPAQDRPRPRGLVCAGVMWGWDAAQSKRRRMELYICLVVWLCGCFLFVCFDRIKIFSVISVN